MPGKGSDQRLIPPNILALQPGITIIPGRPWRRTCEQKYIGEIPEKSTHRGETTVAIYAGCLLWLAPAIVILMPQVPGVLGNRRGRLVPDRTVCQGLDNNSSSCAWNAV